MARKFEFKEINGIFMEQFLWYLQTVCDYGSAHLTWRLIFEPIYELIIISIVINPDKVNIWPCILNILYIHIIRLISGRSIISFRYLIEIVHLLLNLISSCTSPIRLNFLKTLTLAILICFPNYWHLNPPLVCDFAILLSTCDICHLSQLDYSIADSPAELLTPPINLLAPSPAQLYNIKDSILFQILHPS